MSRSWLSEEVAFYFGSGGLMEIALARGLVQHNTVLQVVESGGPRKFVIRYASHFIRCNN